MVEIIPISSANGSGIDDLKAALERRIKAYNNDESSENRPSPNRMPTHLLNMLNARSV